MQANRDRGSAAPADAAARVAGAAARFTGAAIETAIGVLGGAIGAAVESLDEARETEFWKRAHRERPYYRPEYSWAEDYAPAYRYGWASRERYRTRDWDGGLEEELRAGWNRLRGHSRLEWQDAREAVRDAWNRAEQTHRAYHTSDAFWNREHVNRPYVRARYGYDDYRPAYRYGLWARCEYGDSSWESIEDELEAGWEAVRGASRLSWALAKDAVRDAFEETD